MKQTMLRMITRMVNVMVIQVRVVVVVVRRHGAKLMAKAVIDKTGGVHREAMDRQSPTTGAETRLPVGLRGHWQGRHRSDPEC